MSETTRPPNIDTLEVKARQETYDWMIVNPGDLLAVIAYVHHLETCLRTSTMPVVVGFYEDWLQEKDATIAALEQRLAVARLWLAPYVDGYQDAPVDSAGRPLDLDALLMADDSDIIRENATIAAEERGETVDYLNFEAKDE